MARPAAAFFAGAFFAAFFAVVFFAVDFFAAGAVFFATMAGTPSHIVILFANGAGTINRHCVRGNRARHG
ncbi:hypothetical protein GCM10009802_51210 [Streptomyces synnematoformans]|uniref:Uncharacterized protein n=1 Tax=Streptomyces synnematoformans TaxID=415721 RepID=A0ABN2ZE61_9ACTN